MVWQFFVGVSIGPKKNSLLLPFGEGVSDLFGSFLILRACGLLNGEDDN
jgi:hypothetical protein